MVFSTYANFQPTIVGVNGVVHGTLPKKQLAHSENVTKGNDFPWMNIVKVDVAYLVSFLD